MKEVFPGKENIEYSESDLETAREKLYESEEQLNALDLSDNNLNLEEAIKVKKKWEQTRDNYKKILNYLKNNNGIST